MRLYSQILLAFAVAGCSASLNEPRPGTRLDVRRLAPDAATFAYVSGMTQSERLVVRDASAWSNVWTSISAKETPAPALPTIDFATRMVVVAALGQRNSGGYTIRVDSAMATNTGLTVWISTIDPGSACLTTAALTQPVDVASLPRIQGAVRFVDVHSVAHCQ